MVKVGRYHVNTAKKKKICVSSSSTDLAQLQISFSRKIIQAFPGLTQ